MQSKTGLLLVLSLALTACGGGGDSGSTSNNTTAANNTASGAGNTGGSSNGTVTGNDMGGGIINGALNVTGTVSSYSHVIMPSCAGGPLDGNLLGSNFSAPAFCEPDALTTDGVFLYVVDNWLKQPGYCVIRKINLSTGLTTSLAGSWTWITYGPSAIAFNQPQGVTISGSFLYLADTLNHVIRKIDTTTGAVTTFAGAVPATVGGAGSYADGNAMAARFYSPWGITTDGVSLFVADKLNRAIRKIDLATGDTLTLAGNPGGAAAITDGTGAGASFLSPTAIATDGNNLYVIDSSSIRKVVIASGATTTVAGSASTGFADGTGTAALFNLPNGIGTDGTNLFVTDNARVRKVVISNGAVTSIAGGGSGSQVDGVGNAASFGWGYGSTFPYGITSDGVRLYVGDWQEIRKVQ